MVPLWHVSRLRLPLLEQRQGRRARLQSNNESVNG